MLKSRDLNRHSGLTPILISTAASLSVCMLLVAFATDDQPSVMMDWGNLEKAQMMGAYKVAVTAGDSKALRTSLNSQTESIDLSEPDRHQSLDGGNAHHKSSMQEAVKELTHLRKVSSAVWPSEHLAKKSAETSAQMLAHYSKLSSESLPTTTYQKKKPLTAGQELAGYKKLWSKVFPSESSPKHTSWHQTSGDMLAQYRKISADAMPEKESRHRKHVVTAEQELAHLKKLSAQVLPSKSSSSHVKPHPRPSARLLAQHHSKLSAQVLHHAKTQLASPSSRTIAGGLEITDVKVGSGAEPNVGDNIKVHYTGKLASGKVFDSGDISFHFGQGQVIRGWDEGLQGMRVGGERRLVIPPSLAYGERGTPGGPIPPGATLHFDVRLLAV